MLDISLFLLCCCIAQCRGDLPWLHSDRNQGHPKLLSSLVLTETSFFFEHNSDPSIDLLPVGIASTLQGTKLNRFALDSAHQPRSSLT